MDAVLRCRCKQQLDEAKEIDKSMQRAHLEVTRLNAAAAEASRRTSQLHQENCICTTAALQMSRHAVIRTLQKAYHRRMPVRCPWSLCSTAHGFVICNL